MVSVYLPPPGPHRCQPPNRRPRSEWRKVMPPPAMVANKNRPNAKPMAVPTQYPVGTVWRCTCGRLWHTVPKPPPRYGYSPAGVMWRPVRWYQRKLRRQVAVVDTRQAYEAAAHVVESYHPQEAR